jgi:hypothetical protein
MHASRGLLAVVAAVIAMVTLVPAAAAMAPATATATAPGYDISWPQCGGAYPVSPAFGIVGVNKGIVFSPNPCLANEVIWAGGTSAALYANTGNPGPALSTHWPTGQSSPQVCSATNPDSAACAYDYGYNAATDSYADAVAAFTALGLSGSPAGSAWWLDVETSNSWRSDVTLNVAALSGAVDYLRTVAHVASLGFYSTGYQWGVITGGTATFGAYPSWVAGASDATGATANCAGPGFTWGGVALAQYISGGFDANIRCSTATPVLTTIAVAPGSASVQTGGTQPFSATGLDQSGQPLSPQPAFTWSVGGGGSISAAGLFTAGSIAGGPFTVTATSGLLTGTASVTVKSPPPDFSLSVGPASVSVRRGSTVAYTVTLTPSNGFSGSVTLSLSGQPSGSTFTFSPNPSSGTSMLSVRTSSSGPRGTYTLTITARSGTITHATTARLSTK